MFVHRMQIVTGAHGSLCIWIEAPVLALHLHLKLWAVITCQYITNVSCKCVRWGKEMVNNLETHIETVKALTLVLTQNIPQKPAKTIAIIVEKDMS